MNGINKIIDRISSDAQGEIDALTADAKAQADQIAAQAKAQADKESADALAKARAAAAEREERLVSMADMERRKALLAVKQEMVGKAFDLALEKLCQLPEEEYVKLLVDLTVKASRTGREEVILSQKDRTKVGKAVVTGANAAIKGGKLTLSERTAPIRGGLLLSDGKVDTNCTFETLLRIEQDRMAGDVAAALFG